MGLSLHSTSGSPRSLGKVEAMWHVCPVCGEESIRTKCSMDSQGDGPLTQTFWEVEVVEQGCKCSLTEEQIDAIIAEDQCDE